MAKRLAEAAPEKRGPESTLGSAKAAKPQGEVSKQGELQEARAACLHTSPRQGSGFFMCLFR